MNEQHENDDVIEPDVEIEDLDIEAADAENIKGGAAPNAGTGALEARTGFTSNHNETLLRS